MKADRTEIEKKARNRKMEEKLEAQLRELAGMIDHTILKPDATKQKVLEVCQECRDYHFKMIAINSCQVTLCHHALKGSGVHVGAAISFPLGQTELNIKLLETEHAIRQGADEIDYVVNLTELKSGNWDLVRKEMDRITRLCHQDGKICKVIFETCYLSEEEIIRLAQIACEVKPDFIKTSTGFGPAGATAKDVFIMKHEAGEDVQVKAAGGIRSLATLLEMKKAGATRFGTSSSIKIMEEARKLLEEGGTL